MDDELFSFRYGFLHRCAQNGLSAEEAMGLAEAYRQKVAALNKQAVGPMAAGVAAGAGTFLASKSLSKLVDWGERIVGKSVDWTEKLVPYIWGLGLPVMLMAGPALGILGGYNLGKLNAIEDESTAEERHRKLELARAYREGASRLSSL